MGEIVRRVQTGIKGFDEIINGGFVEGTVNLVAGKTGTAKSIFCAQFLWNGATMFKDKVLYITSEESKQNLLRTNLNFGWDFANLEKKGIAKVLEILPFEIKMVISRITEAIETAAFKRVAIDSISMFEVALKEQFQMRKFLYTLFQRLRELGIVTVITAEIPEGSKYLSRFGLVEFMVDSVIKLQYLEFADIKRSIMVRKMRMSSHSSNIHPFEITPRGIEILPI